MYYDPLLFEYQHKPIRLVILDNGIYFVYRDLCRIPGFRAMTEAHVTAQPFYYRIWHPSGSVRVRLLHRDTIREVLCHMRHHSLYAAEVYPFYRWLSEEVDPVLHERPDCQKFIHPSPPWVKRKTVSAGSAAPDSHTAEPKASSEEKSSASEKKPNTEETKDMFPALFTILLLISIPDPAQEMSGDSGKKEKAEHDRRK